MQNKLVLKNGIANPIMKDDIIPNDQIKNFFDNRGKNNEKFQIKIASIIKERIIDNLQQMEPTKKFSKKIDLKMLHINLEKSGEAVSPSSTKDNNKPNLLPKLSKKLRIAYGNMITKTEANTYNRTTSALQNDPQNESNQIMNESVLGNFSQSNQILKRSNKTVAACRNNNIVSNYTKERSAETPVNANLFEKKKIELVDIDNFTKRTNNSIDSLENLLLSSKHSASNRKYSGLNRELERYKQITPKQGISKCKITDKSFNKTSKNYYIEPEVSQASDIPKSPILKVKKKNHEELLVKDKLKALKHQDSINLLKQKSSLRTSYKMGCKLKKFMGNDNNTASIKSQSEDDLETLDNASNRKVYHYKDYSRNLRLVQSVYDSLSDEELENNEDIMIILPGQFSIHPDSPYVFYLNALVFLGLLQSLLYTTFEMTFYETHNQLMSMTSGTIIDVILMIEIISKFFIGFFFEEEIIFDLKYLAANYTLFGEFLLDILVALPFSLAITSWNIFDASLSKLIYFRNNSQFFLWGRWIRSLGVFKLWKKIDYFIYKHLGFEEFGEHNKAIIIAKFAFFFLLVFHILTCFWIFIGQNEAVFYSSSWLRSFGLFDKSHVFQYFTSLNFNVATILSIGYGDITPVNTIERLYMIFYMFLSVHVYSFIISWMSSTVSEGSKTEVLFMEKKETLDSILHEFNVPESFEKQLKKSLKFMQKNYVADKQGLLNTLPEKLKNDIYRKIYFNRIGELDFFDDTPEEFILFCNPRLQLVSLKKREVLISTGDIFIEMYMVNKGNLNFYLSPVYGSFKINTMGKGYHFGDINMYLNERSEYTIKSSCLNTEIFSLKKSHYSELKMAYPTVIQYIINKSIDNFTNLENRRNEALDYYDANGSFQGFKYNIKKREYEANIKLLELEENKNYMSKCYDRTDDSAKNLYKVQMLTNLLKEENYEIRKSNIMNPLMNSNANFELGFTKQKSDSPNRNSLSIQPYYQKLNSSSKPLENLGRRASMIKGNNQDLQLQKETKQNKSKTIILRKDNYTSYKYKFDIKKQFHEDKRKGSFHKMKNLGEPCITYKFVKKVVVMIHKRFREDEMSLVNYSLNSVCSKLIFSSYSTYQSSISGNQVIKATNDDLFEFPYMKLLKNSHPHYIDVEDSYFDEADSANDIKLRISELNETKQEMQCSKFSMANQPSKIKQEHRPSDFVKRNTMSPFTKLKENMEGNKYILKKNTMCNIYSTKSKWKSNIDLKIVQSTIDTTKQTIESSLNKLKLDNIAFKPRKGKSLDSLLQLNYLKKPTAKLDFKTFNRGSANRRTVVLNKRPVSLIPEASQRLEKSLEENASGPTERPVLKNHSSKQEAENSETEVNLKKKVTGDTKAGFDQIARRKSLMFKEKQNDKQKFLGMNKDEMMKDFGRRIDNNAFFENNVNAYEGYLKDFIKTQKQEVTKKPTENTLNERRSAEKRMLKVEFKRQITDKKKESADYLGIYSRISKEKK